MVKITDNALQQLKALKEGDKALRVSVVGGGCSGLSYKMAWVEDSDITEKDRVAENQGLKIVIDPKSFLYLSGSMLDYEGGLNGKGFEWSNPNASRSCGCGSSFGV